MVGLVRASRKLPDLVALKGRHLLVAEAKVAYSASDATKLLELIGPRLGDFHRALAKFAGERRSVGLLPIDSLVLYPTLVFVAGKPAPPPLPGFSYLRIQDNLTAFFEGTLAEGPS